jgi:hypothetical protein
MKYRLYDMYDYVGIHLTKSNRIGEYATLEEARAGAVEYDLNCDGECSIYICKRNPETGTFLCLDAEPMDYDVEVDE